MQMRVRREAKTRNVPGIRRDFGFDQDDVEHAPSKRGKTGAAVYPLAENPASSVGWHAANPMPQTQEATGSVAAATTFTRRPSRSNSTSPSTSAKIV